MAATIRTPGVNATGRTPQISSEIGADWHVARLQVDAPQPQAAVAAAFGELTIPMATMDEGGVSVGAPGSVSGVIDFDGDSDDVTVTLTAGQTYLISLRGTGAAPVQDTFLQLLDPGNSVVAHDDNGGNDAYSLLTITAAASGIYTIRASALPNPDTPDLGGYTVDVRVQGADSVGDTNATAVAIGQGTTFGFRETATVSGGADLDRYAVTLEAGRFYTFKLAAGADHQTNPDAVPTGEIDTILRLRNEAGTLLAQNDDIHFPTDVSSSFTFVPTVSGSYYLDVTGYSGQTGGYALEYLVTVPAMFEELTGPNNPFTGIDIGNGSVAAFVDADSDGDLDLVIGRQDADLVYYRREADGTYSQQTGSANPFDGFEVGSSGTYSAPAPIDLDGDGDLDLVVGSNYGDLLTLRNDGNGTWTETGVLAGVEVSRFSVPTTFDLDGDGDLDLVLGSIYGFIYGFRNNGDGSFTELTGQADPFPDIDVGNFAAPAFFDIEGDGDGDLLVGDYDGILHVFVNDHGTFTETQDHPFDSFAFASIPAFSFVDLDGDGDLDGIAGSKDGTLRTFRNLSVSDGGGGPIDGTSGPDILPGTSGDDVINGLGGDDQLFGGDGSDVLLGGEGNDYMGGGAGPDYAEGGLGNDAFEGGDGDDIGFGGDGSDNLVGGDGDDYLNGGAGADYAEGGSGNDAFEGGEGNDIAFGGDGDDNLLGGGGDDYLNGGAGANYLEGGAGNDRLDGGADVEILLGGDDDDVIVAGGGGDHAEGGSGADILFGEDGNDELIGQAGSDYLDGGLGNDYLDGGEGNDGLAGGGGDDRLAGGAGADTYHFASAPGVGNVDTIVGFVSGSDKIALDDAVFGGLPPGALNPNAFVVGATAQDADDRIVYDQATGALLFDADGNGAGAAVQFATLEDAPVIAAGDFTVF